MDSRSEETSSDSSEALQTAALLGERISLPVLMEAGVEGESLDALLDQGLLLPEGTVEARFADPAIRQKALDDLSWTVKRRLSARIADALRKRRAAPEAVAAHSLNARDYESARKDFLKAAEARRSKNEYRRSLEFYRKALSLWPVDEDAEERARVLRETARASANVDDRELRQETLEELLEMSGESGDREAELEANCQLADLALSSGQRNEAKRRLKLCAELATDIGDPLAEAKTWFRYAGFLADTIRTRESIDASTRAMKAAEQAGRMDLLSEAMALNALSHAMIGKAEEAYSRIDKAITIAIDNELPEQIAIAYRRKANVNEYSGNYLEYRDLELESLERCRIDGHDELESSCLSCVSYAFFRLGQWKRSLEAAREALEVKRVEGELRSVATTARACIAAFRGERKQAATLTDEALRLIAQCGGMVVEFYLYWARGVLASIDDEPDAARAAFQELTLLWQRTDDRKDAVPGLMSAASFYADQNDPGALAECIDILSAIALDNQALEIRAARAAVFAEDRWTRGEIDDAIELGRQALEDYRKQGLPLETALVGRRLGLMLASKGEVASAETVWREAMEIGRDLGLRPLLDVLDKDRRATGASASQASLAEGAGLTKRQLDVLRLIATGLTNKEAAAQLNLSPRTVEMHVASVLERLNCRARTEAIQKATKLGLV